LEQQFKINVYKVNPKETITFQLLAPT